MATRTIGVTSIDPQSPDDVVTGTGGTLDGSNVLQVNYDDAAFTSTESKLRLILALRHIADALEETSFNWPAS